VNTIGSIEALLLSEDPASVQAFTEALLLSEDPGPAQACHLSFTEEYQQQSNWCWAATTASITKFYDPNTTWTQCALANHEFNQTTCCQNGSSAACNRAWYPDRALTTTGHLRSSSSSSATFGTVAGEIDASRPVSIGIYWNGGGGHSLVITGYDKSNPNAPTIDIHDPYYGPTIQDANSFPSTYNGGATWGLTCFTQ